MFAWGGRSAGLLVYLVRMTVVSVTLMGAHGEIERNWTKYPK
jgi:hypothetical protein